jgi:transaldolase
MPPISADLATAIAARAAQGIDLGKDRLQAAPNPFWAALRAAGSELWLDTGDIAAAEALWCSEFTALTTNNTLLNKEVQKGIYDDVVADAGKLLGGVDQATRVQEIAFLLNARHGLRLAQRFGAAGAKVSVELHTDLSHDVERAVDYGRRYYAICPKHFIVKVPLTASGLIATRRLRAEGIPVNFTLGFSARHNFLATSFAGPSYVNVFLGRLNAYIADNKLGDGKMVGEKAMLASQRAVREAGGGRTRHIAASLRGPGQLADLAGVDVYTIPTPVAAEAVKTLKPPFAVKTDERYRVAIADGVDDEALRLHTLWAIDPADRELARSLTAKPPATAAELVDRAHACGAGDLFPRLAEADAARIAADGKIPKHAAWAPRIAQGEFAIDTLLNLAGLASFTQDQAALDARITKHLA